MQKVDVCRTCFKKSDMHMDIFDTYKGSSISYLLKFCVPQLYVGLTIRPKICTECVTHLYASYVFKKKCLRNDKLINRYMRETSYDEYCVGIDLEEVLKYFNKREVYYNKTLGILQYVYNKESTSDATGSATGGPDVVHEKPSVDVAHNQNIQTSNAGQSNNANQIISKDSVKNVIAPRMFDIGNLTQNTVDATEKRNHNDLESFQNKKEIGDRAVKNFRYKRVNDVVNSQFSSDSKTVACEEMACQEITRTIYLNRITKDNKKKRSLPIKKHKKNMKPVEARPQNTSIKLPDDTPNAKRMKTSELQKPENKETSKSQTSGDTSIECLANCVEEVMIKQEIIEEEPLNEFTDGRAAPDAKQHQKNNVQNIIDSIPEIADHYDVPDFVHLQKYSLLPVNKPTKNEIPNTVFNATGVYVCDHDYGKYTPYIKTGWLSNRQKGGYCMCYICRKMHRGVHHLNHISSHGTLCLYCSRSFESSFMLNEHYFYIHYKL